MLFTISEGFPIASSLVHLIRFELIFYLEIRLEQARSQDLEKGGAILKE